MSSSNRFPSLHTDEAQQARRGRAAKQKSVASPYAIAPRILLLSTAVAACFPAVAVDFTDPVIALAGERVTLAPGDTVAVAKKSALTATGQGAFIDASGVALTLGEHGVAGTVVQGVTATQGGKVNLLNSTLDSSRAANLVFSSLEASGGLSEISAYNVNITAKNNASGLGTVYAHDGGTINLGSGQLTSEGSALLALGDESRILAVTTSIASGLNGTISAQDGGHVKLVLLDVAFQDGSTDAGVDARGVGSKIELNDVTMSNGMLRASDGGSLQLDGTSVTTKGGVFLLTGEGKRGGDSLGLTSVFVHEGTFETDGGYVVNVNQAARFEADGATLIGRNGMSAVWLPSDDSFAKLTNTTIQTYGINGEGHGIQVQGGLANVIGGRIDNHGDGTYGLYATGSNPPTAASRISADGVTITSYGSNAGGVFVGGDTAQVDIVNGAIETQGESSWGVVQQNKGGLSVTDADIWSVGHGSGAYRSFISGTGAFENTATFMRTNLDTQDGTTLLVEGSDHAIYFVDSAITARRGGDESKGELLRVNDWTYNDGVNNFRGDTGQVRISANNTRLTGDITVESATAQVALALTNGSTLTGALSALSSGRVSSLSIDASSRWNVRDESALRSLDHAGIIAFVAPAQNDFKRLTVSGDYIGNNGTWIMNRKLGDDASPGDQLFIQGNSSGNASISVLNAGGAGAATNEGIRLISVAGQSNAKFTLQGRSVAGAYEYQLFKGGVTTPDDGNWYLRSEVAPPITGPVTGPETPSVPPPATDPVTPSVPPPVTGPATPSVPAPVAPPKVKRPEPAAYLANQAAALRMFSHSLNDRTGDPGMPQHDAHAVGAIAWAYLRSGQGDGRAAGDQLSVDSHVDSLLLGVGRAFEANHGGSLQVGVMAGQGRARTYSTSRVSGYSAGGDVIGTSLGLYATWLQDPVMQGGFYVDSWLQYGRFRNSVQGDELQKERYRSRNWTGSGEAGYTLQLQQNDQRTVYLEPQLQVLRNRYHADRVVEANGAVVESEHAAGTSTRVGARLYTRSLTPSQRPVNPFVAVNWWSGTNASAIAIEGERLESDLPRDIYEAQAGVQVSLSSGWRGWGQISYQDGSHGYSDISAQIGMSLSW